ncbi:MAG: ABC transporter permease [Peptococcaceae bacterium]
MFNTIGPAMTRELNCLWRDKKALAVVVLVPLLYTLLFGFLYSPHIVTNLKTAVIDYSPSQLSRSVVAGFNQSDRFAVKYHLRDESEIKELMERGDIDVVIIIPENFTRNIKKGRSSSIFMGVNAANMIVSNGAAASALQITKTYSAGIVIKQLTAQGLLEEQAYNTANPISISFRPWFNPTYNYTNYLLLGIISVALQQIYLMSVANSFAKEKEQGTFKESGTDLSRLISLAAGKVMVFFGFAVLSLLGVALLAFKVFDIPLRGSFGLILLMGMPFIVAVISLGIILGVFSGNQVESTQNAMLMAYPTFLLTGFTWPLAAMPEILRMIAHCLPLTYFAENFRKIALTGSDFAILQNEFLGLSILAAGYLLLAAASLKYAYCYKQGHRLPWGKRGKEC